MSLEGSCASKDCVPADPQVWAELESRMAALGKGELSEEDSTNILHSLLEHVESARTSLLDGSALLPETLARLTVIARTIRNACAHAALSAEQARLFGAALLPILLKSSEATASAASLPFLKAGLQFLANLSSADASSAWDLLTPDALCTFLRCSDPLVLTCATMIISNCITKLPSAAETLVSEPWLPVAAQLLDSLDHVSAAEEHDRTDTDFFYLAIEAVIDRGHLQALFNGLAGHAPMTADRYKLVLLRAMSGLLLLEGHRPFPPAAIAFVAERIQLLAFVAGDAEWWAVPASQGPAAVLAAATSLLAKLTVSDREVATALLTGGTLDVAIELLKKIRIFQRPFRATGTVQKIYGSAAPTRGSEIPANAAPLPPSCSMLARELVRLIANMAALGPDAQDRIYTLEGMQALLDCCAIDDVNPFIKEWAIFAIHNACAGHERNQSVLASLQRSSTTVVNADELAEMGFEVETDPDTGKLVVRNKAPPRPQDD
eukprot:m.255325 g.255325  ORF g.255325 m.255325 type:complete len:492 (+) comp19432_c0_seq1:81-1556(+)